ncbi:hypothetical protein LAV_00174 [Sphingobium phage Lacusarx]|uniref:Uncharacterized protein n=1 Tax=Sphingobium phage Lacusarx TaxID=1980139 RepID=A0A1W6DXD6_9CAUD|nr:hypothetical protein FDH44_gp129 [Sphingobium phage Lacusarx]ARK07549.1 hypothetical protein LAV_00174 [Sphingobium phage Lacusarx]
MPITANLTDILIGVALALGVEIISSRWIKRRRPYNFLPL